MKGTPYNRFLFLLGVIYACLCTILAKRYATHYSGSMLFSTQSHHNLICTDTIMVRPMIPTEY